MSRPRPNSKQEHLLRYLEEHESITSMEAFEKLRITRLAAYIWLLVKQGHNITVEYFPNEKHGRYAVYRLED